MLPSGETFNYIKLNISHYIFSIFGACHTIYVFHAQMKKASKIKMDECSKTIVNEDGRKTVGDILCDKIDFFYGRGDFGNIPKPNNIDNVEIAFKYSACENDWTTIASGTNPLEAPEKLCCQRLDGTLKFKRCDGSSFNSKC